MQNLIEKLFKQEKLSNDSARRNEIEKRLNIYHDNYKEILKKEINNQFHEDTRDNVKQMIDDSSNVLKRIIDEISLVYQKNADRSYVIGEKENQNYQDLMTGIPVDIIMQETNRMTNLCNESLVYIVPRKKIEYDILTPDQIEVFQNEDDPTKVDAVLFTKTYVDSVDNISIQKVYWDVYGNHMIFDSDDQLIENFGNPYKDPENKERTILPFVIFHKNFNKDSVWDKTGGNDLVSGTIQIGVLLTYLNYLMKVGSFKMLTFTGINPDDVQQDLIFDPLSPKIVKETSGSIGTVDMQIELEKLWAIIYNKIGALANNYGMSLDNFKLSADAQSGFALKIKNQGLEKAISNQRKFYRYYEKELFEKTKIINNTMFKKNKIGDNGLFKIDFAETEYLEDPNETREQWKFDIKMGVKSIYDYLRFVNPDVKDDKQAEAMLKTNTDINKDVQEKYGIDVATLIKETFPEEESLIE